MLHSPGQETFKHTGQMTNIEFVVEINGGLFKIVAHTIVQIQSGIDNVDTHALNLFRKTLLQMTVQKRLKNRQQWHGPWKTHGKRHKPQLQPWVYVVAAGGGVHAAKDKKSSMSLFAL